MNLVNDFQYGFGAKAMEQPPLITKVDQTIRSRDLGEGDKWKKNKFEIYNEKSNDYDLLQTDEVLYRRNENQTFK